MKRHTLLLISLISLLSTLTSSSLWANNDTLSNIIYVFDIKKEIAPPVWHQTQKALNEAQNLHARAIFIHMNTYGGMLNSADSIRTALLQSKIPVYVFIDNNAASAGALISIACDSIYMSPGANIGAATVVDQQGKVLPDKYQSYMRSMMRATAEAKGRDPQIAQAMVDPRIYVAGVSDSGQVLTFTSREAIAHNFCQAQANSIPQIIKERLGEKDYTLVRQTLKPMDKVIGFLINPMISGILIMIIVGGIYFELQSPGIGFPLGAAAVAALLYFSPLYLEGLAENWEILLFIIGVILIALEIFAIPGFGVAGISGIILLFTGLTLSMIDNIGTDFTGIALGDIASAFSIVVTSSFLALVGSFYLGKKMLTSTLFGQLALDTVQDAQQGYTSAVSAYNQLIGKTGTTHTMLRPAGKILINDELYDATAETGYIEKNQQVRVVKYHNAQLIVTKAEND